MADDTGIQWTDATWNPVRGCSRVSAGCDHCYAMGTAHRFSGTGKAYDGLTTLRRGKVDWTGFARFVPEMLDQPLRWKRPRRIFVNSMSDLFHESLSNEEIAAVFGVMAAAHWHTFQILTKRPKRMKAWFEWVAATAAGGKLTELGSVAVVATLAADIVGEGLLVGLLSRVSSWPLPNVWLGVTAENQDAADERIPLLLETPAAVRFVSAEPLLGRVDLSKFIDVGSLCECGDAPKSERCSGKGRNGWIRCNLGLRRLNWVVVGGESGPGARDCEVSWIRRIVSDCKRLEFFGSRCAVFVKQLGAMARDQDHFGAATENLKHKKGADPEEWPDDLRVREFPKIERAK